MIHVEHGAHVGKHFVQHVDVKTEGNKVRCDDTGSWILDIIHSVHYYC